MIRLTVKGLAKFMTGGAAAQRKILRDFIFPDPEGAVRAAYYAGAPRARAVGGPVVGMLGMDIPHFQKGQIVAVDELGVVDPADNAPDHVSLRDYVYSRLQDGVIFQKEWLAVRKLGARKYLEP